MPKPLGSTLKQYRQERGMTQAQFAAMCRVSRRTIARIESGHPIGERLLTFISKLIQIK